MGASEGPKHARMFDGTALGPRGYLLIALDLMLLIAGSLIATASELDASVAVIPAATGALLIWCLLLRRLPFVLGGPLAAAGVTLICGAVVVPVQAAYHPGNTISGLPAFVLCAAVSGATTLALVVSYRTGGQSETGSGYRSTGITLSIAVGLAAALSLVGIEVANQTWCDMAGTSYCAAHSVPFQWPILTARILPFAAVILLLARAAWAGRRQAFTTAAAAASFLCFAAVIADLVLFLGISRHLSEGSRLGQTVSYSSAALILAGIASAATVANPHWLRSIMTR